MQRRWKSRQILNNRADEANESAARSRRISLLLYSPITTATLNFYVALKCLSRAINYSHGLARIYMRRWGWPYFKNLLNCCDGSGNGSDPSIALSARCSLLLCPPPLNLLRALDKQLLCYVT